MQDKMVGLIELKSSVFEATKLLIHKSFQNEELVSPWTKLNESMRDLIVGKFSLVPHTHAVIPRS